MEKIKSKHVGKSVVIGTFRVRVYDVPNRKGDGIPEYFARVNSIKERIFLVIVNGDNSWFKTEEEARQCGIAVAQVQSRVIDRNKIDLVSQLSVWPYR